VTVVSYCLSAFGTITSLPRGAWDMSLRSVLTGLLPGDTTEEVVECRQCGTTVETETGACPECGATEFSRYVISR